MQKTIRHTIRKKPDWLVKRLPRGKAFEQVRMLVEKSHLHTVCQEAKCPNMWECFSRQTATFLILGDRCTRNCCFCAVQSGPCRMPDPAEPDHVAEAVRTLKLAYAVITSVTRDDLPDGGAAHFARTIHAVGTHNPGIRIEVLIPDFRGDQTALETVLNARPDVLNHNIETVHRLYPEARPQAIYDRSLELMSRARRLAPAIPVKSGIMVGLGESAAEIEATLQDLKTAGCSILTIGQYLQPTRNHLPVSRYVPPPEFDALRRKALAMGFAQVASGPFVRSSYEAKELFSRYGKTAQH